MNKKVEIKGFENLYEITVNGEIIRISTNKKTYGYISKKGYMRFELTKIENNKQIRKAISVHRLVAETSIPNPDHKPFVNHINGIKTDNKGENLEWYTAQENTQHAIKTGLMAGINHPNYNSKLSLDDVKYIRDNYNKNDRNNNITAFAKKYNMHRNTISKVINRKTYKYI